jgi:hypothetical protein
MPTISTMHRITIHGSSLCSSTLHFTEHPDISIPTSSSQDRSKFLLDIDSTAFPNEIQLFLQKRTQFIHAFQEKYPSLSSGQSNLHHQNMSITGTIVQVIPTSLDGQNEYIVILLSEQLKTWYLVYDQNIDIKSIYQPTWVSFGNSIISLHHPDQFIDVCLDMNTTSGYFNAVICKLQSNGLGFLKQELAGSFNSEVMQYSTKNTPFSHLFHPTHKDIFSYETNVISFSLIKEPLPIVFQKTSISQPGLSLFNSSIKDYPFSF